MILRSYDDIKSYNLPENLENLNFRSVVTRRYATIKNFIQASELDLQPFEINNYKRSELHYFNNYESMFVLRFWTTRLNNNRWLPQFSQGALTDSQVAGYDPIGIREGFVSGIMLGNKIAIKIMWIIQSGFSACVYAQIKGEVTNLRFHNHAIYANVGSENTNNLSDNTHYYEFGREINNNLRNDSCYVLDGGMNGAMLDASLTYIVINNEEIYEIRAWINPLPIEFNGSYSNTEWPTDFGNPDTGQDGAKALVTVKRII